MARHRCWEQTAAQTRLCLPQRTVGAVIPSWCPRGRTGSPESHTAGDFLLSSLKGWGFRTATSPPPWAVRKWAAPAEVGGPFTRTGLSQGSSPERGGGGRTSSSEKQYFIKMKGQPGVSTQALEGRHTPCVCPWPPPGSTVRLLAKPQVPGSRPPPPSGQSGHAGETQCHSRRPPDGTRVRPRLRRARHGVGGRASGKMPPARRVLPSSLAGRHTARPSFPRGRPSVGEVAGGCDRARNQNCLTGPGFLHFAFL